MFPIEKNKNYAARKINNSLMFLVFPILALVVIFSNNFAAPYTYANPAPKLSFTAFTCPELSPYFFYNHGLLGLTLEKDGSSSAVCHYKSPYASSENPQLNIYFWKSACLSDEKNIDSQLYSPLNPGFQPITINRHPGFITNLKNHPYSSLVTILEIAAQEKAPGVVEMEYYYPSTYQYFTSYSVKSLAQALIPS